jgi:hypothetical protein
MDSRNDWRFLMFSAYVVVTLLAIAATTFSGVAAN